MKYNKLVRDKIVDVIIKKGGKPKFHIAEDNEYWGRLKAKLQEEIVEFTGAETYAKRTEEFADVLEVLDEMFRYLKLDLKYTKYIKEKKAKEKGRFKKRIILDEA